MMPEPKNPKIIVINGTSSAGKTTLAKALQDNLDDIYLHFEKDIFWHMFSTKVVANSNKYPHINLIFARAVKDLAEHGHNVILDAVMLPQHMDILKAEIETFKPLYVRLNSNLEDLEVREIDRGDRTIGLAASQFDKIHQGIEYDLVLNSSEMSIENEVNLINKALKRYEI